MMKQETLLPIDAVKAKIWTMFNILRSETINTEEYSIVLFLLSLYKDGIISNDIISTDVNCKEYIIERIHQSDHLLSKQYLPIFESFDTTIERLSSKGFHDLIQVLSNLDQEVFTENFAAVFDNVLYRIAKSHGRQMGEYILPVELSRLINSLVELPEKSKVFNPFAGLASFGVFLDQGHDYYGQENNQNTWALGALRLMAYDKLSSSHYVCEDSIEHWPDQSEKFDLIVTNPPFGMRLSQEQQNVGSGIRTVEQFLIEKGVDSLNEKGKLIAFLSQGFLFREGSEKNLRKYLVENDLIDTIISLPSGLLLNTGIPLVILIIDRDKKRKDKVRFINAEKFAEQSASREKIFNDYEFVKLISPNKRDDFSGEESNTVTSAEEPVIRYKATNSDQNGNTSFELERVVKKSNIKELDFNLNTPRYFQKDIEGVKLKEMVDFVRGQIGNLPDVGKMVRIRDLKDDKLDFKLDLGLVEESELGKASYEIDESCLLLATRWNTLKPTLFEFTGDSIFLNPDILAFKIDEEKVDPAYLINELHADYVEEQIATYRQGSTIPMIKRDDLLEVKIKLPSSLEEQQRIVQNRKLELIKVATHDLEAFKKELGIEIADANSFLRHKIAGPIRNLRGAFSSINEMLEKHVISQFPEILDKKVNDKRTVTFKGYLQLVERDLNKVSKLIKQSSDEYAIENKTLEEVKLISFIENYVGEKEGTEKGVSFKKFIDKEVLDEADAVDIVVLANEELLIDLLDNLVRNAVIHGFKGFEGKKEVLFTVVPMLVDNSLKVHLNVSNTGKPVGSSFDIDLFSKMGAKSGNSEGDGLGLWYVKEIMKKHAGELRFFDNSRLVKDVDSDMVSTFELIFPIKDLKKNYGEI